MPTTRAGKSVLHQALAVIAWLLFPALAAGQPTGRNIIFIAVDDMRDWAGYAGGPALTPNIDMLAAQSTRYRAAYTAVPNCAGSRATVLGGVSPAVHGVTAVSLSLDTYRAFISDPALQTLPDVLRANGYYAAGAGKVFHEAKPDEWDQQGPITDISALSNPFAPGPDGTFLNDEVLPPEEQHPDQIVTDWAVDFLDNYASSAPFFLAVGLYQPHVPWRVPQWAYDLYPAPGIYLPPAGDLDDEPPEAVQVAALPLISGVPQYDVILSAGKAQDYTRAYLAATSHTDAMVGQLLAALAASAHAANTDVILWSDHGYHLGEKFHWRKNSFWEPSVRVPLLVSSPGNPDYPAADVTQPVSLLDLAPTVVDLAGLAPHAGFSGAPLHDVANRSPVELFLGPGKATVAGGFKTIDYDQAVPGVADRARYDLAVDPNEVTNLLHPPGC